MQAQVEPKSLVSDLFLPWVVVVMMSIMLIIIFMMGLFMGDQIQQPLPEDSRILIRTIFYVVSIVTFPSTNLIRHIQLRLNQTMPGPSTAKNRYLVTVIVSMALIESIGIFGLVMFIFGDGFNTLAIFIGMSALGLFLYRPKLNEYTQIVEARHRANN
jgi:hypothetical protein